MLLKKLLLELGGLGGGKLCGGGIQVEEDKGTLLLNISDSKRSKQSASKDIKKRSELIKELNKPL